MSPADALEHLRGTVDLDSDGLGSDDWAALQAAIRALELQAAIAALVEPFDRETLLGWRNHHDADATHARKLTAAVLDGEVKRRWKDIGDREEMAARLLDVALGIASPAGEVTP